MDRYWPLSKGTLSCFILEEEQGGSDNDNMNAKRKNQLGIVTIMDYGNYGNRLQNYAVVKYLMKTFECNVKVLLPTDELPYHNNDIVAWLKDKVVIFLGRWPKISKKRFGVDSVRWSNFIRWNRHIPIKVIYNHSLLPESLDCEYDYFVVGSDQVWNYTFSSDRLEDYFLSFAAPKKRIALAASIGIDSIKPEWVERYRLSLEKFHRISVREEQGAEIIWGLIQQQVPVLIDPVMLLDANEWKKVAKSPGVNIGVPYILTYFLGGHELVDEKIKAWAKRNGYIIYNLLDKNYPDLYVSGSGEFITLVANARLVCTDSFHCVAFSIIYSIPFIVFPRTGMNCEMSSRLNTLLKLFGLENRWNSRVKENEYLDCQFSQINDIIKREQRRVYHFLDEAMKD